MTKIPTVSIVMPAYNAQRHIEKAIRSVMAQTVEDWELLVLDDGSNDDTCTIVERLMAQEPRISLLRNERNLGVAQTRNRGLERCCGEFVALLDSDDVWYPEKLERQIALLRESGAALCCCAYDIIGDDGAPVKASYDVPDQVDFDTLLKENVVCCSTVVLRGDVARNFRFDAGYYHEDYVLWLQLLQQGYRIVGCLQVLAAWRLSQGSRSYNKLKSAKNRWIIYREYLRLPLLKCIRAFCAYAVAGLRKYH